MNDPAPEVAQGRSDFRPTVHNARYDFSDTLCAFGAPCFAEIVRRRLPPTT